MPDTARGGGDDSEDVEEACLGGDARCGCEAEAAEGRGFTLLVWERRHSKAFLETKFRFAMTVSIAMVLAAVLVPMLVFEAKAAVVEW